MRIASLGPATRPTAGDGDGAVVGEEPDAKGPGIAP